MLYCGNLFMNSSLPDDARPFDRELFLSTLINNLPGIVYRCANDRDRTLLSISDGCREITGYDPADFTGTGTVAFHDIIVPEYGEGIRQKLQRLRETGGVFEAEYRIRTKNGELRWVLDRGRGIFAGDGKLLYLEGCIMDVTARNREILACIRSNHQLRLYLGVHEHDALNEIMILKGYLELSKQSINEPGRIDGYLRKGQSSLDRLLQVFEFTRTFCHSVGATVPVWQNVDTIVRDASASLPLRKVNVIMECPDLEVFADPSLSMVFRILIDNALRHGGDRLTRIRIFSQTTEDGRILVCADDGTGISENGRQNLFQRGYGENHGAGLFLVRQILDTTGITIRETGSYGNGARFEMTVPEGGYRFRTGTMPSNPDGS